MKIGYARVSTGEQKLDLQIDALTEAGCDRIFSDQGLSGAKTDRPGLQEALAALQPGDRFVVWKLDRAGRSVFHLAILLKQFQEMGVEFCSLTEGIDTSTPHGKLTYNIVSCFAEFMLDINRERTIEGMEAARRRGKTIGRPRKLSPQQITEAIALREKKTLKEVAATLGIEKSTLWKAIRRAQAEEAISD